MWFASHKDEFERLCLEETYPGYCAFFCVCECAAWSSWYFHAIRRHQDILIFPNTVHAVGGIAVPYQECTTVARSISLEPCRLASGTLVCSRIFGVCVFSTNIYYVYVALDSFKRDFVESIPELKF